jgi:hypothetical protein
MRGKWFVLVCASGFVFNTRLCAFDGDTLKSAHVPRHYFNTTIYSDLYSINKVSLDTINTISKKIGTYKLSQFNIGFGVPVVTKDFYNKDSTRISNIHFLLTGNYSSINIDFGGIRDHKMIKTSLGFRGMYNNGKKSIFFAELSPFETRDKGYAFTRTTRLATTVLYDCVVNPRFSFRLGFTRSFLWGNRFHLPYIGFRIGRLDKVNFSVQFPRSITFNVPVGKYIRTSLYTKPQGGVYSFANTDSVPVGNIFDNKKLYFGRNEFLTGLRIDIIPGKHFSFYFSSGFTTSNYIAFFPGTKAKSDITLYNSYYKQEIKPGLFVNAGLVLRFGKTKSYYNNAQMYDMMDLNNSIDAGDNGTMQGNGNIPLPPKKIQKASLDEVLDLIEAQDLY